MAQSRSALLGSSTQVNSRNKHGLALDLAEGIGIALDAAGDRVFITGPGGSVYPIRRAHFEAESIEKAQGVGIVPRSTHVACTRQGGRSPQEGRRESCECIYPIRVPLLPHVGD